MIWLHKSKTALSSQRQHQIAWDLLKYALSTRGIKLTPDLIAYGPKGKPFFQTPNGVHFSLSHDATLIVAALQTEPIGIDVEAVRAYREGALRFAFSDKEQRVIENSATPELSFFSRWCLKESEIKRKGKTIDKAMKALEYSDLFSFEQGQCLGTEFVPNHQAFLLLETHVVAVSGINYECSKQLKSRLHCL